MMPFYKVTYSDKYKRATIHNYGCNFRCRGCSYKLLKRPKPERFLSACDEPYDTTTRTGLLRCVCAHNNERGENDRQRKASETLDGDAASTQGPWRRLFRPRAPCS